MRHDTTGRHPAFSAFARAMRLAALSLRPGAPPVEDIVPGAAMGRREFLGGALAGAAVLAGASTALAPTAWPTTLAPRAGQPRIVVVGAGTAGLACAYRLRKAGVRADVYEAGSRPGGRMFTVRDVLADGLATDLGGEFIDSSHEHMRGLARELGLELLDKLGPGTQGILRDAYYFEGREYSELALVEAIRPMVARIAADAARLPADIGHGTGGFARTLDRMDMGAYLDRIGASGWVRRLVEVCYITEYGLETRDQSALNLVTLISTDATGPTFDLIKGSDERYRVSGGAQRIPDELAGRLGGRIHFGQVLEAIRSRGAGFVLSFASGGSRPVDVQADIAILAIPFSVLRHVQMRVELPRLKLQAIRDLGYGTNSKYLLGFERRPWRDLDYPGFMFSDGAVQCAWDNTGVETGPAGGITVFQGGKEGLALGTGTDEELSTRFLADLDAVFKGTAQAHNGRRFRWIWPADPFALGSYACLKPGQWTAFSGVEGDPVGNLIFAGEHTSSVAPGFMEGAAESGHAAAEAVLARLRVRQKLRRRVGALADLLG